MKCKDCKFFKSDKYCYRYPPRMVKRIIKGREEHLFKPTEVPATSYACGEYRPIEMETTCETLL